MFSVPDLQKAYFSGPLDYVDYVLTYGGENSLTQVLDKKLGLASDISCSADVSSAASVLWVAVGLTEKGQKHPDVVLDVFFKYLGAVKQRGVDMELYRSIGDVAKLNWDWAPPSSAMDTASDVAERMTHQWPREALLSSDRRIDKPDGKLVGQIFDSLSPEFMNVAFIVPAEGAQANATFNKGGGGGKVEPATGTVQGNHLRGPLLQTTALRATRGGRGREPPIQVLPHYGVQY